MCLLFFFFKQKTAYEMRISDWSSDVCSSDLAGVGHRHGTGVARARTNFTGSGLYPRTFRSEDQAQRQLQARRQEAQRLQFDLCHSVHRRGQTLLHGVCQPAERPPTSAAPEDRSDLQLCRQRSEEHTSELQSLMRISYAVFCLKKKKNYRTHVQRARTLESRRKKQHHKIINNIT